MRIDIDKDQLSDAARDLLALPGLFEKAKLSALKSTGYMIRKVMRDFIESGGRKSWAKLHPLTRFYFKKHGVNAKWSQKTSARGVSSGYNAIGPMFWLGKHARYSAASDSVVVGFGKSHSDRDSRAKRSMAGSMDPFIMNVVKRAEEGEVISVTGKMRRKLGATRYSNNRFQEAGGTFFAIRGTTKTIETEKRPIFDPVMELVKNRIQWHFEDRFIKAVVRKQTGVNNKSWL